MDPEQGSVLEKIYLEFLTMENVYKNLLETFASQVLPGKKVVSEEWEIKNKVTGEIISMEEKKSPECVCPLCEFHYPKTTKPLDENKNFEDSNEVSETKEDSEDSNEVQILFSEKPLKESSFEKRKLEAFETILKRPKFDDEVIIL